MGGGFGSKISRNSLVSCAAILASSKLGKPVKLWVPLQTNMNVVGKRVPCTADYEVGVNNEGIVQYLDCSIYSDLGSEGGNENVMGEVVATVTGSYNIDTWNIKTFTTRSDNATSTWCRAPGEFC